MQIGKFKGEKMLVLHIHISMPSRVNNDLSGTVIK